MSGRPRTSLKKELPCQPTGELKRVCELTRFSTVADLLRSQGRAVEVKPQPVRPDVRTFLRGIRADDLVQRPMQQVRGGMVRLDGPAAGGVDLQRNEPVRWAGWILSSALARRRK